MRIELVVVVGQIVVVVVAQLELALVEAGAQVERVSAMVVR